MKMLNTQQIEAVSGGFLYVTEDGVVLWSRAEMEQEYHCFVNEMMDYFAELKAQGIMVIEI